jgi:hypothetical protein
MSETNLGAGLLKQAGLSAGTLPAQDREALRKRIEQANARVRRLKQLALLALTLFLLAIATAAVARNGPYRDQGIRLLLTHIAVFVYIVAAYGGVLLIIGLVLQVVSARALEMTGRLANMENLLEGVVVNLDRVAQRLENPNQPREK